MLSKTFSTVGRKSGRSAARSRFHTRAGIRGIALLFCVFGLLLSFPVFIALASPAGQDGSGSAAAETPTGNSVTGKNLFTGSNSFEEGGPACLACHSIAGIGALGGGALGPNLTGTFDRLGAAMVFFPESLPPMEAIFTEKPLTEAEKAHLLAFFESAAVTERPTRAVLQLSGLAVIGTLLMMGLAHITWLRRNRNVRKTMVGQHTVR